MKKIRVCGLIGLCGILLCGCGSFPELTKEQEQMISEYAAGILLKHSGAYDYRLTDNEESMIQEITDEVENDELEKTSEPDETLVSDKEDTVQDDSVEETNVSMEELLGMEEIVITSKGYEVLDSYPNQAENYFALDAADGCKLLVAKYTFANHTENLVNIDMLLHSPSFKISLNGSGYRAVLPTMLLDDMSTYVGKVEAGKQIEVVLITEWKEEEVQEISQVSLYIKTDEATGTYMISR